VSRRQARGLLCSTIFIGNLDTLELNHKYYMSHDTTLYLQIINRAPRSQPLLSFALEGRKEEARGIDVRRRDAVINVKSSMNMCVCVCVCTCFRVRVCACRVRGEQPGGEINISHSGERSREADFGINIKDDN